MPALAGRLMSQTISSTLGSRSASAAPSPRPTADVHQGIMWPMDPMPVEVTPTPMPVEVTQMPTDPANFWLGLIAAVGLFALSGFPAWDRLIADMQAGKTKNLRRKALIFTMMILLPLALLLTALAALGTDPVPNPNNWQKTVSLCALGVCVLFRALFPSPPNAEQAAPPRRLRPRSRTVDRHAAAGQRAPAALQLPCHLHDTSPASPRHRRSAQPKTPPKAMAVAVSTTPVTAEPRAALPTLAARRRRRLTFSATSPAAG